MSSTTFSSDVAIELLFPLHQCIMLQLTKATLYKSLHPCNEREDRFHIHWDTMAYRISLHSLYLLCSTTVSP